MKRNLVFVFIFILFSLLTDHDRVFAQTNYWQSTNGPNAGIVNALAINSKGHIFAVCNGVYRSTDNGSTWTKLNTSISTSNGVISIYLTVLTVIPHDYILGGSYGAIYMSTDDGNSWQKQSDVYDWYCSQLYRSPLSP